MKHSAFPKKYLGVAFTPGRGSSENIRKIFDYLHEKSVSTVYTTLNVAQVLTLDTTHLTQLLQAQFLKSSRAPVRLKTGEIFKRFPVIR